MKIKRMTACFGRLQNETVALGDGLNLITAPNEAGKSTWSAFLRAMLYGMNTKERDRQGYLAEKNRYQPWSGAAMEGSMELHWRGKDITLRRGQKGTTPFGLFEAVYTDTGEPVGFLTGENAGEELLGVPREVFERSAFVGQGATAVDGAPALEKRIAALVSSGEEDVSYSQVERRLRDWLNSRKHNKTGIIPRLERELAILEDTISRQSRARRLTEEAQQEMSSLEAECVTLEHELCHQRYLFALDRRKTYEQATASLEVSKAEVEALRAELTRHGAPPDKETLRRAQENLNSLTALSSNIKLAEIQRVETQAAADQVKADAQDPLFPNMTPDEAWQKASADTALFSAQPTGQALRAVLAGIFLASGGTLAVLSKGTPLLLIGGGVLAVLSILLFLSIFKRKNAAQRQREEILDRYDAQVPDDILARAAALREQWGLAAEAQRQAESAEQVYQQLTAQRTELKETLLDLVHTFAPTVTDTFGVSAALSRALALGEKLSTAAVRLEGARRLADSVPQPDVMPPAPPKGIVPRFPYQETSARLAAIKGELSRLGSSLAMAQGELKTLGDPVLFQARREVLLEELERRRSEYAALELALETLSRANGDLQARFSPALNQKSGQFMQALTGGKYDKISLTREFEATAGEPGGILPRRAITLSRGTMDQLYLAVRLAVCALALPGDAPAPLVLDDALASFDDHRMALALDLLRSLGEERQILLFTCHTRESAYLTGQPGVTAVTLP